MTRIREEEEVQKWQDYPGISEMLQAQFLLHHVINSKNFNPLDSKGNYSATSNDRKLVHWPLMGGLLHLVQQGGDWVGCGPPNPLLAVPNVTAHPSTASAPITVLLYDCPLLCGFNVELKGLMIISSIQGSTSIPSFCSVFCMSSGTLVLSITGRCR